MFKDTYIQICTNTIYRFIYLGCPLERQAKTAACFRPYMSSIMDMSSVMLSIPVSLSKLSTLVVFCGPLILVLSMGSQVLAYCLISPGILESVLLTTCNL